MRLENPNSSLVRIGSQGVDNYRKTMLHAIYEASKWLEEGELYKGVSPSSLGKLYQGLDVMPREGIGDEATIHEAAKIILDHSLQVHHPACIAHLHCPTTLSVQAAEVLLNIANQSMDSWDQSPAGTMLEQRVISWLRTLVGYEQGDAGVFTSGGTLSNLMGILLARDFAIKTHWSSSARLKGLPWDLSRLSILCSEKAHFSVNKSAHLLGLGEQAVIPISTDENDRMNVSDLRVKLGQLKLKGKLPFCLVATAGTTDAGAIDPIDELSSICSEEGIWLHVDAAWGGALLLSHKYSDLLNGISRADSITLDFHKHFYQTISSSAFLLKNSVHYQLMHSHADYLNPEEDVADGTPNLVEKSLQTTRRFDALKLWMTFRSIGGNKFGNLIDTTIELAKQVSEAIKSYPEFKLILEPQLSSVLFRVELPGLTSKELDELNREAAKHLLMAGIANLGVTKRNGETILKFTLLNPNTEFVHVQKILNQILTFNVEYLKNQKQACSVE